MGAEKNFVKFAERMEEDGEPLVNLNYFRQLVAKAILFRSAEKVFSSQDLEGYRANSVAYAVAWLSERSDRRIDLDSIWSDQRLPAALVKALEKVCAAAHSHITHVEGNPGEISKREGAWAEFRDTEIDLPPGWQKEWAKEPFVAPTTAEDALAGEWEKIRHHLVNDSRTIEGLEAYTNRLWVPRYRRETVSSFATMDWQALRTKPGLGLKKLKGLVEMFAVAAQD